MNPAITRGARKEKEKFDYNKDADMFVCPAGHLAMFKRVQDKKINRYNQAMVCYFDVEKCNRCPLRDGSYKPEARKAKLVLVAIKANEHIEQEAFQQSGYTRGKSRRWYKIEAKNSELKNVHGYDRADSYGLKSMKTPSPYLW